MNSSKPKTILIIDDDPEIAFSLKIFLESENYRVLHANNGLDALNILKKEEMPHLILLDMKMPIMNGWQFAQEYLNLYDHFTPIVVITAASDALKRSQEINAAGCVAKPFNLDNLLSIIKKHERSE